MHADLETHFAALLHTNDIPDPSKAICTKLDGLHSYEKSSIICDILTFGMSRGFSDLEQAV